MRLVIQILSKLRSDWVLVTWVDDLHQELDNGECIPVGSAVLLSSFNTTISYGFLLGLLLLWELQALFLVTPVLST